MYCDTHSREWDAERLVHCPDCWQEALAATDHVQGASVKDADEWLARRNAERDAALEAHAPAPRNAIPDAWKRSANDQLAHEFGDHRSCDPGKCSRAPQRESYADTFRRLYDPR